MNFDLKKYRKLFLRGLKIAVGSSISVYLAELLQLDFAISAGTITLLTIVTTKWDTVKLSLLRVLTLGFTILLAWIAFKHVQNTWVAYSIFIFILVIVSEMCGLGATISVNSVIGAHLLTTKNFSVQSILNECLLVAIGITIAVVLNLFYDYRSQKTRIVQNMRYIESQLKMLLTEMANTLTGKGTEKDLEEEFPRLIAELGSFTRDAYEYQDNTFQSHPGYYIDYFEMRNKQLLILQSIHTEMMKITLLPKQAKMVAKYILYLVKYIEERTVPTKQEEYLDSLFERMGNEPLPASREEFESRSMLFHILMDLREFINAKQKFISGMTEKQMKLYWNQTKPKKASQ